MKGFWQIFKDVRLMRVNVFIVGIKVDPNELFRNIPGTISSAVSSNLTSAAKEPINI
jgi:hypothetical protein